MTKQQEAYNHNIGLIKATPKGERYKDPACLNLEGEIDEMIYPAIEMLNEKGYYTQYSCSGHYKRGGDTEIIFDPEVTINTAPPGFKLENITHAELRELTPEEIKAGYTMQFIDVSSIRISKQLPAENERSRFVAILLANATLLQWAMELPNRGPN